MAIAVAIEQLPAECIQCEWCDKRSVAHAEYHYNFLRLWCRECTPWSGHYEWELTECKLLMERLAVRMDELREAGQLPDDVVLDFSERG